MIKSKLLLFSTLFTLSLFASDSTNTEKSSWRKYNGSLKISAPKFTKGGPMVEGRSRPSIMRVIMQNVGSMRYYYNKRLKEREPFNTKLTLKFSIDQLGNVIRCENVNTLVDDSILVDKCISKVMTFKFEKFGTVSDTTELVYPFVFVYKEIPVEESK